MYFLEIINTVMGFLGGLLALGGMFLFFKDPIRRWNFFGYRPTVILVFCDSDFKTLLINKIGESWVQCPQGGIYTEDIQDAIERTAKKELGLDYNWYQFRYSKILGTHRIKNSYRMKRDSFGGIKLFPLRGKAYIACYLFCDSLTELPLEKGSDIDNIIITDFSNASKLLQEKHNNSDVHDDKKRDINRILINEASNFIVARNEHLESIQQE